MISAIDDLLREAGLSEWLVFANTPAYLFRNLRENQYVQSAGEDFSTEEILEYLKNKESEMRCLEDLAGFYGALVALSLKSDPLASRFLTELPRRHPELRWLDSIVSMIQANQVATSTIDWEMPAAAQVVTQETAAPDFCNNQFTIGDAG